MRAKTTTSVNGHTHRTKTGLMKNSLPGMKEQKHNRLKLFSSTFVKPLYETFAYSFDANLPHICTYDKDYTQVLINKIVVTTSVDHECLKII